MSNDAKLGLVMGVAIVVLIALVFFRSDNSAANLKTETPAATPASVASARN